MSLEDHRLLGTWHSLEDTLSVIEYQVVLLDSAFAIHALDSYGGEHGEVTGNAWNEISRSFRTHAIGLHLAGTQRNPCAKDPA